MALDTAEMRKRLEANIGPGLQVGSNEELRKGQKDFSKWGSGLIVGSRDWIIDQLAAKLTAIQASSLSCEPPRDYEWQTSKLEAFCVRLQALIPGDVLAGYYVGRIGNDQYGAFGYGIMEDITQAEHGDDSRDSADTEAILQNLKVLVAVALADGHIDESERTLLEEFCRQHGLASAQLSAVINEPMTVARSKLPQSREGKLAMLVDVLRIAAVNGHVEDSERRIAGKIAKALGLNRDDVKECAMKAVGIARSRPEQPAMASRGQTEVGSAGACPTQQVSPPQSAAISSDATTAQRDTVEATGRQEERDPSGNRSMCQCCQKPYGIVPSLGFVAGGYQCESCGMCFCGACGYQAAKAKGRATMICPKCSSDRTKGFRA